MEPRQIRDLLSALVQGDAAAQEAARRTLYMLDEAAVDPLCEEFYSGVNEATGLAILEVVAAIGGPDALRLLKYAQIFGRCESWQQAAQRGLAHNSG